MAADTQVSSGSGPGPTAAPRRAPSPRVAVRGAQAASWAGSFARCRRGGPRLVLAVPRGARSSHREGGVCRGLLPPPWKLRERPGLRARSCLRHGRDPGGGWFQVKVTRNAAFSRGEPCSCRGGSGRRVSCVRLAGVPALAASWVESEPHS